MSTVLRELGRLNSGSPWTPAPCCTLHVVGKSRT